MSGYESALKKFDSCREEKHAGSGKKRIHSTKNGFQCRIDQNDDAEIPAVIANESPAAEEYPEAHGQHEKGYKKICRASGHMVIAGTTSVFPTICALGHFLKASGESGRCSLSPAAVSRSSQGCDPSAGTGDRR